MAPPTVQQLARLLLLSQQGQSETQGPTPTEEELIALHEGKLSFKRKQEVYAYLNRSPELFRRWIDFVEANHDAHYRLDNSAQQNSKGSLFSGLSSLLSRFNTFAWGGCALAMVFAVTLFSNLMQQLPGSDTAPTPMTIQETAQLSVDLESLLRATLEDQQQPCTDKMKHRSERERMFSRLQQIRQQYRDSNIAAPPSLPGMAQSHFTDENSACRFGAQLLSELLGE
jgi:hypothetical protein